MSRIEFTQHAIERYIERCCSPGTSVAQARSLLERASTQAIKLKEKTNGGQIRWKVPYLDILLVTKPDGGNFVCVTVLDEKDIDRGPSQEELDMVMESAAVVASSPRPEPEESVSKRELHVRQLEAVKEIRRIKEEEKTKRHTLNNDQEIKKLKAALKIALRCLTNHALTAYCTAIDEVEKARTEIDQIEPGYLSNEFLTTCGKNPLPEIK